MHSVRFGLVALSIFVAAQTPAFPKTFPFVVKKIDGIGWYLTAMEDRGGRLKAHTLGLELTKSQPGKKRCKMIFWLRGIPTKAKDWLSTGRYWKLIGSAGEEYQIFIDGISKDEVTGRLTLSGATVFTDALASNGAAPKGALKIDDLVEIPQLVNQTQPSYSQAAIDAKVQGILLMQLIIRRDGSLEEFRMLKGLGYGLDEAALESVANEWRFKPGTKGGTPVDVLATVEVSFTLRARP